MLKIVKTALITTALCAGFSMPAHANVDEALANICTIVKADDKGELRKKMRRVQSDFKLKLKDYYAAVSCGGNSLIRTAMLSDSVETGKLLVKKMPKSELQQPEVDGKTLTVWISENGLNASPIATALSERI